MALLAFAFVPVLFGMIAKVAVPGITDANTVLPNVLTHALPPWLGAIALAAVFSTEVDTCDAILFMLSTSASKDLYKRFINLGVGRATAARRRGRRPSPAASSAYCLSIWLQTVIGADHRLLLAARRHVVRAGDRRTVCPAGGTARKPWPRSSRVW